MAIQIPTGSSNNVGYNDPVPAGTTTELTVAITVKPTDTLPTAARLFSQWGADPGLQQSWIIFTLNTDEVGFYLLEAFVGYLSRQTDGTNPLAVGVTSRIMCRWKASPKTLAIDINGVSQSIVTDGNDNTLSALNNVTVGMNVGADFAGTAGLTGDYSEAAVYTEYVPDWVAAAYGKGMSLQFYRPATARFYAPLVNTAALTDRWGGLTGANAGGSDAAHPSIYYPDLRLDGDAIPTTDDHLIIVPVGSLTLTGLNPILPRVVAPGVGALVITGRGVPDENTAILPGVGSLLLTGLAPMVTGTASLGTGGLILTGLAPTLFVLTTAHVSTLAVEVSRPAPRAGAHVSSLHTEVLAGQPAIAQVSMLIVEVLRYFTEPPCIDVHPAGCPVEFAPPPAGGGAGCVADFGPTGTVTS